MLLVRLMKSLPSESDLSGIFTLITFPLGFTETSSAHSGFVVVVVVVVVAVVVVVVVAAAEFTCT